MDLENEAIFSIVEMDHNAIRIDQETSRYKRLSYNLKLSVQVEKGWINFDFIAIMLLFCKFTVHINF